MMVVVAALAALLGLGLEVTRLTHRYRYCREMARRHAAWGESIQKDDTGEFHQLRRLDAVALRFSEMGPDARSIDELVRDSGDPDFTAWFLKGQRRALLTGGEDRPVTPGEFVAHIEHLWGNAWRGRVKSFHDGLAKHSRLRNDYLSAAYRPWVRIPPDPPPHPLE